MRALIAATALLGLALLPVVPAHAAKPEKVGVCHKGDDGYVYIQIPTKQIEKGVGHARHTDDKFGLSKDECLALNAPKV